MLIVCCDTNTLCLLRPIYASLLNKNDVILTKKLSLDTLILCCVPGEMGSVANIIIFCHVMRLDSVKVAMEMVICKS